MSLPARKTQILLAFGWLAAAVLVACTSTSAPPKDINVSLKTFTITLSSIVAKAGDVTFHIKNDATDMKHEFVVFKTDLAADKLPVDAKGSVIEDQLTKAGELEVEKSQGGDLKISLTPGHYVAVCNIEGHYKASMRVEFSVVP
jgi:uncharacterized cupredoxin-like copper-binding protein